MFDVEKNAWLFNKNRNFLIFFALLLFVFICVASAYFLLKKEKIEIDLTEYSIDPIVIVDSLEDSGYPYVFDEKKSKLVVGDEQAEYIFKLLSVQGSKFDRVGFEVFDVQEYGVSDFKQKVSLVRALQGELEKTILSMDGVMEARVHLVINNSRFQRKKGDMGKASVYLKLTGDTVSSLKKDVMDLVLFSVPNLGKSNIKVITNQNGSFNSLDDYPLMHHKIRVEDYYKDKVIGVVSALYSASDFVVNVDISISSEDFQSKSEKILPANGKGVITSTKERVNESSKGQGKGLDKIVSKDIEQEFRTGTTLESIKKIPFSIERKSVAVLVLKAVSENELKALRAVLIASTGMDTKHGDEIVIRSIPQGEPNG